MKLSAAVVSAVGNVRKVNQDNLYMDHAVRPLYEQDYSNECRCAENIQAYSVCDGMGGEQAGEEAALRAVKVLAEYPTNRVFDNWRDYIDQANESVCELCRERSIRAGTTFSGVFFQGNRCTAVNVGDSRIYLISHNTITQISLDHTQFQTMVDAGLIEKDDRTHDRARSQLTQHFGIERDFMELEPHVEYLNQLQPGDMILMCSDGLYGEVEDSELLSIIRNNQSLLDCCSLMVKRAEENGSRDNITAMLIRVEDEPAPEPVFVEETDSRRSYDPPRSASVLPAITIVLGIVCAVLLILLLRSAFTWQTVSDVTGQTMGKAKKMLENKGFQVMLDGASSADSEAMLVSTQSIPGGVRAKRGSEITLVTGDGAAEQGENSEDNSAESSVDSLAAVAAAQKSDSSTDSADNADNATEDAVSRNEGLTVQQSESGESKSGEAILEVFSDSGKSESETDTTESSGKQTEADSTPKKPESDGK